MAAGDITTIPIKDGGGTTRQVPFEEQADGSLSPVHFARGAEGAVIATQATLASVLSELQAHQQGTDAEPVSTQLKGRTTVQIGGVDFDTQGGNVFGLAADKPSASDAHAAIPFCYYISADTQAIEQTDGSSWVVV